MSITSVLAAAASEPAIASYARCCASHTAPTERGNQTRDSDYGLRAGPPGERLGGGACDRRPAGRVGLAQPCLAGDAVQRGQLGAELLELQPAERGQVIAGRVGIPHRRTFGHRYEGYAASAGIHAPVGLGIPVYGIGSGGA